MEIQERAPEVPSAVPQRELVREFGNMLAVMTENLTGNIANTTVTYPTPWGHEEIPGGKAFEIGNSTLRNLVLESSVQVARGIGTEEMAVHRALVEILGGPQNLPEKLEDEQNYYAVNCIFPPFESGQPRILGAYKIETLRDAIESIIRAFEDRLSNVESRECKIDLIAAIAKLRILLASSPDLQKPFAWVPAEAGKVGFNPKDFSKEQVFLLKIPKSAQQPARLDSVQESQRLVIRSVVNHLLAATR